MKVIIVVSIYLPMINKEDSVNRREDQADMDSDMDEEDMEDLGLVYEREHHWRMILRTTR